MIRIRHPITGETQNVLSTDAYADWEVIGEGMPIEALRLAARDKVKAIRHEKETGICSTPLGMVQIDDRSKLKIDGALSLCRLKEELSQPFSIMFTMADNSRVQLNGAKMRQMAGAVGLYVQALWDHADSLFQDIEAAADEAALSVIELEAGWP